MIYGIFGKLGSGKGLYVVDVIAEELLHGFRDVVTNVPLRFAPWVNGQGTPQIGLRQYLVEKLGAGGSLDEADAILQRVKIIEDIDQGNDLFMWRRDGETGEWFKLTVTKVDDKGRPERFDGEEIKKRHCAPVLCVTDEAWQFYPNNGGWSRVPLLPFYARQQRKLRDDWYIVTQHPTDVDTVLWNIAQLFGVCRNHGMERMGMFRQPSMFRVVFYLTNPAKGNAIRSHESYKTLDKRLSQCYDTTAGVGIAGGFKGDANQKKKGLHIAWLGVGLLLLVGLLAAIPHYLGKAAASWIGHTVTPPKDVRSWAGLTNAATSGGQPKESGPTQAPTAVAATTADIAPDAYCTGYVVRGRSCTVFLSDGSKIESRSGRLKLITEDFIIADGRRIPVRPAPPEKKPEPSQNASQPEQSIPEPAPMPKPEVNRVQITPGIHGVGGNPPPSLYGFETMNKGLRQAEPSSVIR